MPFPLFHLGPGAVMKAIGGRHFSFMVFGGAQVLIDLEPLATMLTGTGDLHGRTHTLAGALVIGIVAMLTGKPISSFVLRRLRIPHYPLTWGASAAGAFLGTFSHVVLDALLHADLQPWWPLAGGDLWAWRLTFDQMHVVCTALAVLGAAGVAWRWRKHGKA